MKSLVIRGSGYNMKIIDLMLMVLIILTIIPFFFFSFFFFITGLLSPIIQCLTEKQQNLKVYALSALNEIAKHNRYLAQTVVDVKCLPTVIQMLLPSFTDITLQANYNTEILSSLYV